MRRLLWSSVIAVCLATPLSGRAQVVFLDDVMSSPISEVVLMGGDGHLIGLSDREGRVLLDSYPSGVHERAYRRGDTSVHSL